jgi:hypothetical protein
MQFRLMAPLLGLLGGLAHAADRQLPRYLAPGSPRVGGVRHLCLIYHGQRSRVRWTARALLPYVAYVDAEGRPRDWLFDSFLFIEFANDAGLVLHHHPEGAPLPTLADWEWLGDAWFREDTGLIGLERAVTRAARALQDPDHRAKVVLTLPVPFHEDRAFGPLPGTDKTLDFADPSDQRRALAWYVDRVLCDWQSRCYRHLDLVGFYWLAETIPPVYEPLVRSTARHLHRRGLKLYWIPYFGAQGLDRWRRLGIDATMLQPNHFFTERRDERRLTSAAKLARLHGTGIEVEFDGRAIDTEDYRTRFWGYLEAGAKYGWMREAILGYYEGGGAVQMLVQQPERGRELYDSLYRFVHGTYEPSNRVELGDLLLSWPDRRGNLALARRGAEVHGCIRRDDQPDLVPEKIIDGEVEGYGGMSGFGYIPVGGSFTVELPRPVKVARTQVLLFDLDDRFFRYRIETSIDGRSWEVAVDKSAGEWAGWQVDRFSPRTARLIRFTGLHNSVNDLVQVVELETYSTP